MAQLTHEPGLNAGRGSKFLTAKRAESFIEGVRILKYLLEASPCGIYWGCLVKSPSLMVFFGGKLPSKKLMDVSDECEK